jgi:hypothetical protein
MWDETDYEGRWIQAACAVFLAIFSVLGGYVVVTHIGFFVIVGGVPVILGSIRLCWRCAYYAVTGKNNINCDDY